MDNRFMAPKCKDVLSGLVNHTARERDNANLCFQKRCGKIDWKKVAAIDIEKQNIGALLENAENIIYCNIESEIDVNNVDPLFIKLFKISQLITEYLMNYQNHSAEVIEKMQAKANKAINDLLREKSERKKELRNITEFQPKKRPDGRSLLVGSHINRCTYCTKVFSHSKYLVKHILRRHPDELLDLHRELTSNTRCKTDIEIPQVHKAPGTSLEEELKDLKKMIFTVKSEISEHLKLSALNQSVIQKNSHISSDRHYFEDLKERDRLKNEEKKIEQTLISEVQDLKLKCRHSENIIKNLEEKYNDLLQSVKQDISLKEERKGKKDLDGQKILKEALKLQRKEIALFKEELDEQLSALQSAIFTQMQQQDSEWKTRLLQLEQKHICEAKKMQALFETNIAKLSVNQTAKNMDKILEQQLQGFLNKLPRNSVKKQSSSSKYPLTGMQQNGISIVKPITVDEHQTLTKVQHAKEFYCVKRVKAVLPDIPNLLDGLYGELLHLVEDKMQSFGINSAELKLENSDFDVKQKLVHSETQTLSRKYDNYETIRNYFEELSSKEAYSLMVQGKSGRKITFVEPENAIEQPVLGPKEIPEQIVPKEVEVDKRESYGFVVSDPVFEFSSVKERIPRPLPRQSLLERSEKQASGITKPVISRSMTNIPSSASRQLDFADSDFEKPASTFKKSSESIKDDFVTNLTFDKISKDTGSRSSLESLSSWDSDDPSTERID